VSYTLVRPARIQRRASVTGQTSCSDARRRITASASPPPAAGRPLSERTCRTQRAAPGDSGGGRGGGMATSGEPVGSGGWDSTRSTLRSRAIASIGYLAGHADLARYLALVVNELLTAGALPPNGPATELGSPYIKYKGSCLILAASRQNCRDAMKIDRHHGVQIDEIDPLDGCVQSWLHPRVGLDSHR